MLVQGHLAGLHSTTLSEMMIFFFACFAQNARNGDNRLGPYRLVSGYPGKEICPQATIAHTVQRQQDEDVRTVTIVLCQLSENSKDSSRLESGACKRQKASAIGIHCMKFPNNQ